MDSNVCPNCQTSLPGGFRICGKCGTRLESNEAMVDTSNSDPSGAIRSLIGPGFSTAQPMTKDARPRQSSKLSGETLSRVREKLDGPSVLPELEPKRKATPSSKTQQFEVIGKPKVKKKVKKRPRPAGKPAGKPASQAIRCPRCSSTMGPGNKFCGNCGSALELPKPVGPPSCMNCGTKGQMGQKFCGSCGNPY